MKELNTFRKFIQENELHEGTWSLGSPESIDSVIKGLQAIIKMVDDAQNKKNAAGRGFVDGLKNQLKDEGWNSRIYRIVGDDSFHDAYDNAKAAAELNDFDRVKNGLGDAIARAAELRDTILKNRDLEENDAVLDEVIEEGTWALGSVAEMVKVMGKLSQISKMGAAKGSIELENLDNILYNVFGDDEFHDAIDAAKGTDDDDRFNNFMSNAQARAKELYKDELRDAKEQGETGFEFKPRFGLEENDNVLDEVSNSMGIFKEIDAMIGSIKDQMNPDDAFDSLVSEFEAISGGTRLLHQALKNISLDNNLMEEKDEE